MTKSVRIVSAQQLDWPQHSFVLHAPESQRTNDFPSFDDVPEGVRAKLAPWLRSGAVKVFEIERDVEGIQVASIDITTAVTPPEPEPEPAGEPDSNADPSA